MSIDPLEFPNCVCFNLRRAARRITGRYDQALKPADLQATQFTLLAHLDRLAESDASSITELAQRLGMDRTTLNRNLRVVQREKWVEVHPGADRRQRKVRLTPAGRRKLEEAEPLWRAVQTHTSNELGPDAFQDLLALVARISD